MAARAKKTAATKAVPQPVMVAGIKGFDAELRCREFQFEVGKTYNHEGPIIACRSGFHAITEHPLAVFDYYPPAGSRFCLVEVGGATHSDDGIKTAAEILRVGRELGLGEMVQQAVQFVLDRSHPEGEAATGYRGAASATGYRGAAMACGCNGQVRGAAGNALFAVERESWNGPIVSVAGGIVGKEGIEPDRWYRAVGGKLVPA